MAIAAAEISKFEAEIDAAVAHATAAGTTAADFKALGTAMRGQQATTGASDRDVRDAHDKLVDLCRNFAQGMTH